MSIKDLIAGVSWLFAIVWQISSMSMNLPSNVLVCPALRRRPLGGGLARWTFGYRWP
jgi:hypothetical protein